MRFVRHIHIIILCLFFISPALAQELKMDADIENILQDIYYQMSEEDGELPEWEEVYSTLRHYSEHPINLNNTTKEELERLHVLSDLQIENLLYYLYSHGKMHSIYELRLIEGMESYHIRNLLPFVYIGETSSSDKKRPFHPKEVFRYGRHQVMLRIDRGAETKEGYRLSREDEDMPEEEIPTSSYKGDPFYTSLRYTFRYKQHFDVGIRVEKDAGEQFWGKYNKGFDSYGGHVQVSDIGCIQTLVVGDFKAKFGQGLMLNSDFRLSKSASLSSIKSGGALLRKSSSTNEYNFFRGVGSTLRWGHWQWSGFYSYRRLDADTTGGYVHSISETGLHRTESEYAKWHTVGVHTAGMNVSVQYTKFRVGANVLFNHLSLPMHTSATLYNQPTPDGKIQFSGSLDYQGRVSNFLFFGETALTHQLGWASINGVKFYPCDVLGVVALHRYYSGRYYSMWGNSFSESSSMRNEQGFYVGIETSPIRHWKFTAYADVFRFPYPQYGIDKPSEGFDYMLESTYSPHQRLSMSLKARWKQKLTNVETSVLPLQKAQLRYHLICHHKHFSFKTRLDGNLCKISREQNSYGYSIAQDIGYNNPHFPLSGNLRFQMFHTDTYNNRIYIYENDVLYAFSNPISYGTGCRYYLNLKYSFKRWFSIWLKVAQTVYADGRSSVGSSHDKISGNRKTDFRLLFRFSI